MIPEEYLKLKEVLPNFRILLSIKFVLGFTTALFSAWLWYTTQDFAKTLSKSSCILGIVVAFLCILGSIADRRASKSIQEMSDYGAAINKYKEIRGLSTFISYQVICFMQMGVGVILGGQGLFYQTVYNFPSTERQKLDFDSLAKMHEEANIITLKIYIAGCLCILLAVICFFLIISVLQMMREEGERIKTLLLMQLLFLLFCAVMMHVIDHILNHGQIASALYGGIFKYTETLVIFGAWVILVSVLIGSCLVSTESRYGLRCYFVMLIVIMTLYVALLYLQFHARSSANQNLQEDCFDVMSLLHSSEMKEMDCPYKYKNLETEVKVQIDYGYPAAVCPKQQVRVAWEEMKTAPQLKCLNKSCCDSIVANLASESDVSILLTFYTISVGILTIYAVHCLAVKLQEQATHLVQSPGPNQTSPLQWLIALFFILFAALLVFSLFFKTQKDFLMMNVDQVPGNPVSVAKPQLWRVGSIQEPSWVFLGDTSLTVEAEPQKMFYLQIESDVSELRVTSIESFNPDYFKIKKQEWSKNDEDQQIFQFQALGTIYSVEKAVRLLQYRAICPGQNGIIEINLYDTQEDNGEYVKDQGPPLITLKKPTEMFQNLTQILEGSVVKISQNTEENLKGATVTLKSPDFPKCAFNSSSSNQYGHFEVSVPLFVKKNGKKISQGKQKKNKPLRVYPTPYSVQVSVLSQNTITYTRKIRVGEMPFAMQREMGEFPLLESSLSNRTIDFYTSIYDTNDVEPLEDVRVNITKIDLVSQNSSNEVSLLSNAQGLLMVEGLEAGSYSLNFQKESYLNQTNLVTLYKKYARLPSYYMSQKFQTRVISNSPIISSRVSSLESHKIELALTWDSAVDLDMFLIFNVNNKLTCLISYAQRVCGGAAHKFDGNGVHHNLELINIETVTNTAYMVVVTPHFNHTQEAQTNQRTNAKLQINVAGFDTALVELQNPTGAVKDEDKEEKGGDVWLALCFWGSEGVKSILPLNTMVGKVPVSSSKICSNELAHRGI